MAGRDLPTGRRQPRIAQTLTAMRLGRRLEAPEERHLTSEGHLDVVAPGELQHGTRVDGHLAGGDVAGDAGEGADVGLR